jgi:hypothetical protein
MNNLNAIELADRLATRNGAQIVTMITRTQPALKGGKKSPLAGKLVEKQSRVNGMVNWSYENAVNNQRQREQAPLDANDEVEEFISHPRKWGQRVHKTAFVRHIPKGTDEKRVYVEFKHQNSLGYQYFIDGLPVDESEVTPFLRDKSESSRQEVEHQVILRDYRLSSIEYMTFAGETFAICINEETESNLYDQLEAIQVAQQEAEVEQGKIVIMDRLLREWK